MFILGAQHSRVVYERVCEVNIGTRSRNLPHADQTLMITLRSQPPPAPIVFPGNKINQQHLVFYLAQIIIRYKVSH